MGTFARRVRTKSGATAVQIVHKRGRRILSIEHVGSAHDDVQLALLMRVAHERIHFLQSSCRWVRIAQAGARSPGRS